MIGRRTVSLLFKPGWIEAVELQEGFGGKLTLTKSGRFPVMNQEPEQMIQAIRGALDAARIRTSEVVLGLPSSEVLLRHFMLPQMPKNEWRQAIQFEARKFIPFKVDDLIWNFHAVEHPTLKQLQVVFVGAQQVTVAQYVSLLAQAGLKPIAVESPTVGLTRMILRAQPSLGGETFAAAEVSGEMAHIMLVKDGVPYFARDVSLAGREATKPVDDFVATTGEGTPAGSGAAQGDDRLELLISELHYSFNYFLREFPEDRVSRVLLCGEPVGDEWLEALTKELRVSVERTPSAFRLKAGGDALQAGAWAVASGLAMAGTGKPKKGALAIPLDWRVSRVDRTAAARLDQPLKRLLAREAAIAVGLLVALALLMQQQVAAVRRQIALEQQSRPAATETWGRMSVADLEQQLTQATQRAALMRRLVDGRVLMTPKLEAIARLLPEGTWLSELTYNGEQNQPTDTARSLAFHGYCFLGDKQRELATVTGLSQQLKDTQPLFAGFATAALSSVRDDTLGTFKVTSFEMRCASGGDHAAY